MQEMIIHPNKGINDSEHRCSVHGKRQLSRMHKVRKSSLEEVIWELRPSNCKAGPKVREIKVVRIWL